MNRVRLRVFFLALSDVLTLGVILGIAVSIDTLLVLEQPISEYYGLWVLLPIFVICNMLLKLYHGNFFYPGAASGQVEELRRLFQSLTIAFLLFFGYGFFSGRFTALSPWMMAGVWMGTAVFLPVTRWIVRSILKWTGVGTIRVLIAGAGRTGRLVAHETRRDRHFGFEVVGFLDDDPHKAGKSYQGVAVLGMVEETIQIARQHDVHYLVVCLPVTKLDSCWRKFSLYFKHVLIIPDNRIFPISWILPVDFNCYPGFEISNQLLLPGPRMLKNLQELLMSVAAAVVLFPALLLLATAVKLTSRGPIFYRAKRLGRNDKPIQVYKFRTMYIDADANLERMLAENPHLQREWERKFKLDNDPRITPLGRFLRRTSLDELPQLWNVIKGDMALIGPRPIVDQEKRYYRQQYDVFSRVKPGVTGLWQVTGRSDTSYETRILLDMFYIMNWSPWLDYFILLKTVKEVLQGRGAR